MTSERNSLGGDKLATATDPDWQLGVAARSGDRLDLGQHVEALLVGQTPKNDVLVVALGPLWWFRQTQVSNTHSMPSHVALVHSYRCKVQVELAGIGVRAGVHNGQHARARVPEDEVLVLERVGEGGDTRMISSV